MIKHLRFYPLKTILVDNKKRHYKASHIVFSAVVMFTIVNPTVTFAGVFSDFTDKVRSIFVPQEDTEEESSTSQTMQVFKPVIVDSNNLSQKEEEISSSDSLSVTSGSLRISTEDVDYPIDDTISVYEVKKGDSLLTVARLFGVSKNTIIWANDLKSEKISPGDTLVILPITGIKHTIKKGDTVLSIAKKYKADVEDIAKFNGVAKETKLIVGNIILVPEGEITIVTTTKTKSNKNATGKLLDNYANSTPSGFLIKPVIGARRTQGLHGHNGIDLGAPQGTPVLASGSGVVIVAKSSGYNGGYGQMIVISHDGGVQTVYAHLHSVYVSVGQTVTQGQVIGEVGNTGKSTGAHLHFEVRGAKNPF